MANRDNPHGLKFVYRIGGGPEHTDWYTKLAAFGTGIFDNDVVIRVSGIPVNNSTLPGLAIGVIEPFASATPGTTLSSGVSMDHAAASVLSNHCVIDDPNCIFEGQDNNSTDGIAAGDLGKNANLVATAGNATTKVSKHQIDEATVATSAARDLHLIALFPTMDVAGNAFGSNARILSSFALHRFGPNTAGV